MVATKFKSYAFLSWSFTYYTRKKGLNCRYPDIFNDKKVVKFDQNGRPIGEDGVDLIDQYWASVPGGFDVNGDVSHIARIWGNKGGGESGIDEEYNVMTIRKTKGRAL